MEKSIDFDLLFPGKRSAYYGFIFGVFYKQNRVIDMLLYFREN